VSYTQVTIPATAFPNYINTASFATSFLRALPQGAAWNKEHDSNTSIALYPLSNVMNTVYNLGVSLINDVFPATTVQHIPEWQSSLGIDTTCVLANATIAQQQQQIVTKLTNPGGCSLAYYVNYAAQLGYTITINNYGHLRTGFHAGDSCWSLDADYTWIVHVSASAPNLSYFECMMLQQCPAGISMFFSLD